MLRRYRFWLIAAVIFQFLAGATHTVTLFINPEPTSDQEKRLWEMVNTFKPEVGPWFHPSFGDLITAFSSCFSFTCLLGAFTLGYLIFKGADLRILRGITMINLIIFGALLGVTLWFTFILPVTFAALIFINLLIGYLVMPSGDSEA